MSKFASLKDEVVYRATLNGFVNDEIGDVSYGDGWNGRLDDFYGKDYIVNEDSQGFITVQAFSRVTAYNLLGPNKTVLSRACFDVWQDIIDAHDAATEEDDSDEWTTSYYCG